MYYPHVGGIETIVRELSALFKDEGIESIVLTKKWPVDLPDEDEFEGVKIYRVSSPKQASEYLELAKWLKENNKKIRADIIHVIGARRPLPFFALMLSKLWRVPLIISIAGSEIPWKDDPTTQQIWNEGKEVVPESILQADIVTAYSKSLQECLAKTLPALKKVRILYGGIPDEKIKMNTKKKSNYIFSLRRLVWSKGIDVLVRAFAVVHKKHPEIQLKIAGDGDERKNLEVLVKTLNIEKSVEFLGTIDLKLADSYLENALLSVVPSRSEGGGLANIESQALGCPVVATNVGGIEEYLGKDGALVVQPDDPEALADAINQMIENEKLRDEIIENGYKNAKKFSWNKLAPEYLDLYSDSIQAYKYKPVKLWSELSEKVRGIFDANN